MTSRTAVNIVVGIAAIAGVAALQIAMTPFILRRLGSEQFGLVAFLPVLSGIFRLLDFGFSTTIVRVVSRFPSDCDDDVRLHSFLLSFELVFLIAAIAMAAAVYFTSRIIATEWLSQSLLADDQKAKCIALMGLSCGITLLSQFYASCLLAREQIALCNTFRFVEAALVYGGGLAALWIVAPEPEVFILATVAGNAFFAVAARATSAVLYALPLVAPFSLLQIVEHSRFGLGALFISTGTFVLSYLDKVLIIHFLTLEEFAFYNLATAITTGIAALLIAPIFNSYYPRMSAAAVGDSANSSLIEDYRTCTQWVSVLYVPLCVAIAFFSLPLTRLWLGDEQTAVAVSQIVSILIIGTTLNGILNPPYILQLALGKTSIPILCNIAGAAIAFVGYSVLIPQFGSQAAAATWTVSMLGYFAVSCSFTATLIGRGFGRALAEDVATPAAATLAVVGLAAFVSGSLLEGSLAVVGFVVTWMLAAIAALMVCGRIRTQLGRFAKPFRTRRQERTHG